jgi:hypothetical protein
VSLGRNRARPRCTVWARPSCAALFGEPVAARRRCVGSGRGAAAHRCGNDGRRRGVDRLGFGRDGGAVGEAVGTAARSTRRRAVGATAACARQSGDGWRGRGDCWGDGGAGEAGAVGQARRGGRCRVGVGERGSYRDARRL